MNFSKELPKFPFAVATGYLAESFFFLALADQDSHLRFGHFGTGGGLGHAQILQRAPERTGEL